MAIKDFEILIHLISLDHKKSESNPQKVLSINVLPTWNLLDSFSKQGLKKFIYFSTFQIYGNPIGRMIKVGDLPIPQNMYGLSHYLSEIITDYYNYKTDTECTNIRLSNSFGAPVFHENNCWWLAVNDMIKMAFNNKQINLLSDGTPQRDFIHIEDICNSIEVIINSDMTKHHNTMNIASGRTFTIFEFALKIKNVYKKLYNIDIPIFQNDNSLLIENNFPLPKDKYCVDISDLIAMGYTPKNDFEESIEKTFVYLENSNKYIK